MSILGWIIHKLFPPDKGMKDLIVTTHPWFKESEVGKKHFKKDGTPRVKCTGMFTIKEDKVPYVFVDRLWISYKAQEPLSLCRVISNTSIHEIIHQICDYKDTWNENIAYFGVRLLNREGITLFGLSIVEVEEDD